jgi:hypothetical protein
VALTENVAKDYAAVAARSFGVSPNRRLAFNKERAREDAKKDKGGKAKG